VSTVVQAEPHCRHDNHRVETDLYWQATQWLALEHLHLVQDEHSIRADGLIIGSFAAAPLRLRYGVECDPGWRTTALRVTDLTSDERIEIHRSSAGWHEPCGAELPELAGAIDVDIAATPFTNTLPIRRTGLKIGQGSEITVVYVAIRPRLSLRLARQRYTRLPSDARGSRYLYESLESDFRRELVIDSNGFVIDYPGIWQQATPHTEANSKGRHDTVAVRHRH
jgi:hypothetical protein